jgi:hypothetical protein
MELPAENTVSGKWLDKKELNNTDMLKIVSEAKIEEGQNGPQLVCKVKVKGGDNEAKNIAINKPSKRALVEKFGNNTTAWIDQVFSIELEKTNVGGKRGLALYLIPEDYQVSEDENGYIVVNRKSFHVENEPTVQYPNEEINPEDIPF